MRDIIKNFSAVSCMALLLAGLGPTPAFAQFEGDLQVQGFRYASESSPSLYLSSKSTYLTENFLMKMDGYFESGSKGAWSFDPDPIRLTLRLDEAGKNLIWIGREHPLNLTRSVSVDATSALGTIWGQNQLNALYPRVSGWVGAGIVKELTSDWKLIAAYSPIFIPTLGPSLGFTERGELNPSRYARLPPVTVSTNGILIPIRYKIELGQLSDLLFQHQAMLAISQDAPAVQSDAFVYSAPKPNPIPYPQSTLGVTAYDVNARVNVQVQFPRETWTGLRTQLKTVALQPALEMVQKLNDLSERYVSVTGYFNSRANSRASFGLLTHVQKHFDSPTFSDLMIFLKWPVRLSQELELRTLVQTTWMSMRRSMLWINELEWTFTNQLSLLASIRILTGEDNSYFGDWRDQDAYTAGMRWWW